MKGAFRFFIYSNLFIAGCVVLMVYQTSLLLLHTRPDYYFTGFVFFSTLCSYSFHWYLTTDSVIPSPRIEWLRRRRYIHTIFFFIGLAGAAFFFFYLAEYWPWLFIGAVATFLYSAPKIPHPYFRALRKIALGKTIFLAFVWMYVTTLLPVIIAEKTLDTVTLLFVISRFFFIYAICILFDIRDRQDDKAAGIRSLITFLNEKEITILFFLSLLIFAVCTLLLLQYGFGWLPVFALLLPGLITGLLYRYASTHFSDMFYYFILDGLLAFSSLLMLIPGI